MSVAYLHNGAGAGRGRRSTATQIWGWEKMPKAIYRSGENTYELFMQFPSKGNTWYIEGVYGDKDQADEAYREAQTWLYRGKPPGIRLVRSVYSESTGEFTDQVITRRGDGFFKRSEKKIPEDVKAELKKGAAGAPGGEEEKPAIAEPRPAERARPVPVRKSGGTMETVGMVVGIVLLLAFALVGWLWGTDQLPIG